MGKRTVAALAQIDQSRTYGVSEAVELLTKLASAKFDESLEVHLRLGIDPKKGDQLVRGTVTLPHGTGKTVRVAVFASESLQAVAKEAGADLVGGEDLIADIKKSEKTDFDVAVATPDMMPKMGPIAKILGTRGLMPNPKNDTVTNDVKRIITELKKGKVTFKNDDTANLHLAVGKVSFGKDKLAENVIALLDAVQKIKPRTAKGTYMKTIALTTTMGPSIRVSATL
ncbi:MAG: 50S ribosomal protein L1 [Patescibacteria group bacterium]